MASSNEQWGDVWRTRSSRTYLFLFGPTGERTRLGSKSLSVQEPPHTSAPGAQVPAQVPLLHRIPTGQALLHVPQWAGSTWVLVQMLPQAVLAKPVQVRVQVELTHSSPAPQAVPQAPQCSRSEVRSRQAPVQAVWVVGHCRTQAPAVQVWPAVQALPQVPQLASSVCRSRQTPLHAVCPAAQTVAQVPLEQGWPAGHALPQAPQCCGESESVKQPPLHSACPSGQKVSHWPPEQTSPVAQAVPHAPQCRGSVWSSTHRPAGRGVRIKTIPSENQRLLVRVKDGARPTIETFSALGGARSWLAGRGKVK
jgi:hypothetical protein